MRRSGWASGHGRTGGRTRTALVGPADYKSVRGAIRQRCHVNDLGKIAQESVCLRPCDAYERYAGFSPDRDRKGTAQGQASPHRADRGGPFFRRDPPEDRTRAVRAAPRLSRGSCAVAGASVPQETTRGARGGRPPCRTLDGSSWNPSETSRPSLQTPTRLRSAFPHLASDGRDGTKGWADRRDGGWKRSRIVGASRSPRTPQRPDGPKSVVNSRPAGVFSPSAKTAQFDGSSTHGPLLA